MEKLSLLLKGQILEEVCVVVKESGDRFAAPLAWSLSSCLSLHSQPSRRPRDAGTYRRQTAAVKRLSGVGVAMWVGLGGSFRWGRGFVLRASDDVLIFISCY